MGLEVWPYPSGGSGLRSVPGSPGHGGTVTGTRLHTDTKLSPDTLDPAPARPWTYSCPPGHLSSPKFSGPLPLCPPLSLMPTWLAAHPCPYSSQYPSPCPDVSAVPVPSPLSTQTVGPPSTPQALPTHLSRCWGTAGCGSRCPSPRPLCSNTLATSHSVPGCCHRHPEPPCQSSTPGAHCPQGPAWVGWAGGVGMAEVAGQAHPGWQVPGAVSLGMCLGKQRANLAQCGLSLSPLCYR